MLETKVAEQSEFAAIATAQLKKVYAQLASSRELISSLPAVVTNEIVATLAPRLNYQSNQCFESLICCASSGAGGDGSKDVAGELASIIDVGSNIVLDEALANFACEPIHILQLPTKVKQVGSSVPVVVSPSSVASRSC